MSTNSLREAAQQALEALDYEADRSNDDAYRKERDALRAALAEPVQEPVAWMYEDTLPKEYPYDAMWSHSAVRDGVRMFPVFAPPQPAEPIEPVAWSYELATTMLEHGYDGWEHRITRYKPNVPEGSIRNLTPLYTAPPQRKPLTQEKIWHTYKNLWMFHPAEEPRLAGDVLKFARAIEAAHGIKDE